MNGSFILGTAHFTTYLFLGMVQVSGKFLAPRLLPAATLTHSWNRPIHERAVPSNDRAFPQMVPPFMDP